MATAEKFGKKSNLSPPPSLAQGVIDLEQHATVAPAPAPAPVVSAPASATTPTARKKLDGRSMRKTHRKEPFSTRVTEQFKTELFLLAAHMNIMFVEVLEEGLALVKARYEAENGPLDKAA